MDRKKATFLGVTQNYKNQKIQLTFEFEDDVRNCIDEMQDIPLAITVKKFRTKRSLDANAYYWQLLTKLADKLTVPNPCMHNMLLRRYGQLEEIDGKTCLPHTAGHRGRRK